MPGQPMSGEDIAKGCLGLVMFVTTCAIFAGIAFMVYFIGHRLGVW